MSDNYQLTGKTAAEWITQNPVLKINERGFERGTGKLKIGDGIKTWLQLSYVTVSPPPIPENVSSNIAASVLDHVNDLTPHPVYDDGPSLLLLYENAKV